MTQCMVRPCVARGFVELTVSGLASMYPAFDWSSSCSGPSHYQTCARPRLATNDPVLEEQASLPRSALPSSRRGGRSRSTHSASLAGYSGGQVIKSGQECPQDRGRVRLVISDDQIDGRRLTFQWTNGDR